VDKHKKIEFNQPFFTGKETEYIRQAVELKHISGNGFFSKKCHQFFQDQYKFKKCLLTSSCTDALEMAAILCDIKPGDEVIVPSYTFVSTANAFVLRGAKIVFADSRKDHPGIDEDQIELLITKKTKAIVPVHYAGIACDMDKIMAIAEKHNLFVVEDAAQAIDSYYKGRPLGGIGHMAAFSFHETKNIVSGEGGMLVVNDERFCKRAEIIWEKGTNRAAFWRGEVDKYGWVDVGSSFLPSELTAAFLFAQLENLGAIQEKRASIWGEYHRSFVQAGTERILKLPSVPMYATNNYHMFYVLAKDLAERSSLIQHLKTKNINSVFHYQSLHKSPFYSVQYNGNELPNSDRYSDALLRLPFHCGLLSKDINAISSTIGDYLNELTA
jgi:dTDP-4-amino-4,6-dideoxygalactose transaminase